MEKQNLFKWKHSQPEIYPSYSEMVPTVQIKFS